MLRLPILLILARVAVSINPEVHQKYLTLPHQEFIEYFNEGNFSFTITHYDRTFQLGSFLPDTIDKFPQKCDRNTLKDLPKNFDSREKWANCETIKEINDQGHCLSCWTFGAGNTASDRTCIHKDIHVHLSEQDFECLNDNVCNGGDPVAAFGFWKEKGLVTNQCKPYDIPELKKRQCNLNCVTNDTSYDTDKHFAENVYSVCNQSDVIQAELVENGPIQAGFAVYEDFYAYEGGVYEHTYGILRSYHSVRVIGFGEEGDTKYWLVANSWGKGWGEEGLFRIKAHGRDAKFEEMLYTGMPKN